MAIFALTDGSSAFVISSHGCWMPGTYATRQAARFAFQFDEKRLVQLRDLVNGQQKRAITTDDLQTIRSWHPDSWRLGQVP